jgi:peptidoglycan/xylan/chitin deacetylase (PgdA/CDA1 family)
MLAKHNIQATFFLLGKYVEKYPTLVKRIHQSGHQLGVHGYRHIPFPLESSATLRSQLDLTRRTIAKICDITPEVIGALRPPYGAFTPQTTTLLTNWGYQLVMWNNLPPHWMQPVGWTISQIFDQIAPGEIIVLHDGHGHGTKVSQILDVIIPKFKMQGYDFVTIAQMQANKEVKPQEHS